MAATLVHAMSNPCSIGPFQDFGPGGYPHDAQRTSAVVAAVMAAVVAWLSRGSGRRREPAGVSR